MALSLFFDCEKYRICCITHQFFTCGSANQYEKVFNLIQEGVTLHELAQLTWICSTGYSLEEVRSILSREM